MHTSPTATEADTSYLNTVYLDYSKYRTPEVKVEAHTFDFDLIKQFDGEAKADYEATFLF